VKHSEFDFDPVPKFIVLSNSRSILARVLFHVKQFSADMQGAGRAEVLMWSRY
jgi:hypothetical protein